jgi:ATP adenylyltransferase
MSDSILYAPWRIEYIKSLRGAEPEACFFCQAAQATDGQQRRQRLVLWQTDLSVVLMNRYPYANGHLLIAPRAHKADLEELGDAEHLDLQKQTTAAAGLLRRAISAQGFNIGINLGRVAGAGVPGHIHQHIVPRWGGDTNFLAVVGQTRVIPDALEQLYDELSRAVGENLK